MLYGCDCLTSYSLVALNPIAQLVGQFVVCCIEQSVDYEDLVSGLAVPGMAQQLLRGLPAYHVKCELLDALQWWHTGTS